MPSPFKRPGSDNYHFRLSIPKDVALILYKIPRNQWPPGWMKSGGGRAEVLLSTGTPDRRQAKMKAGEFLAAATKQFQSYREGPKPLTVKQVSYLSGMVYRAFTEILEDNPGMPPAGWLQVAKENELAKRGRLNPLAIPTDENRDAEMEQRFGGLADAVLRKECILTTPDSRWLLIEAIARDMTPAAEKLARNAGGDYSPDTYPVRFPKTFETGTLRHSLAALITAWRDQPNNSRSKRVTIVWGNLATRFAEFLGHDNLSLITRHDVQRWSDHRLANGIAVKTIKSTDLAALQSVFGYGIERGWLQVNPATGVKVRGPKPKKKRDKFFSPTEIAVILNTALHVSPAKQRATKTTGAMRWVPWLCAYSGARVREIVQLRKEDIRQDGKQYVMRITPDAGTVKTGKFRDVPIHGHLIATGFDAFLRQSSDGPLFTDAQGSAAYEAVRVMVREVVPDEDVAPNHAWRHTFKTIGHAAGIDTLTLDAICGHAPKSEGDRYTHVPLSVMIEAMGRFPRYSLK